MGRLAPRGDEVPLSEVVLLDGRREALAGRVARNPCAIDVEAADDEGETARMDGDTLPNGAPRRAGPSALDYREETQRGS